jgi:hypothetical protein
MSSLGSVKRTWPWLRKAWYRPAAPGDGMGSTYLTEDELVDPEKLNQEAAQYVARFIQQEDAGNFEIGISNYRTNRALVYAIEAAKELCSAQDNVALRLLKMAIKEIEAKPPTV